MKARDLERFTDVLKDYLGLRDWYIEVRVLRHYEMSGDRYGGETYVNRLRKQAKVYIQDPQDMNPALCWMDRDWQINLTHEFIHVALPGDLDDGVHSSDAQEQAIDALAKGFVRLLRENERKV